MLRPHRFSRSASFRTFSARDVLRLAVVACYHPGQLNEAKSLRPDCTVLSVLTQCCEGQIREITRSFLFELGSSWYRGAQTLRVGQNSSTCMKVACTTFWRTTENLDLPKANRRLRCRFGGCALAVARPWP